MLSEQDNKLCKHNIKSFEHKDVGISKKKIKLACPFPGSVGEVQGFSKVDTMAEGNHRNY